MKILPSFLGVCSLFVTAPAPAAPPVLLDDQFVLPPGFHIYRAAAPELTGGSYDLTFDGDGRLLVGDGQNVRRLKDEDGDGVYDSQEVIAKGLGGRGPQGLLVYGDHLYAVGGDGVQLFSGYNSDGPLKHEGRVGAPFSTGGDHAAHTLLRGLDGWIYLVSGDGGGTGGRKHITEKSSPVQTERAASVFRFSPDGKKWECIGAGGRNPPSLGMNYLGEFFSFDSDMEWHVDIPFYRPVRLNHWSTGADLGWQGTGAFPPYYIDTIPSVLDVGRGSPNWGVFYEHYQFPKAYRDAFICCDYRWKSATSGGYDKSGRLVTFFMKRAGASWKAEMRLLAEAKPGAKEPGGKGISFAVVDVDVAPDGSLMVSDHNQGVWRIFYDAEQSEKIPPIVPDLEKLPGGMFGVPQPGSEWSRLRFESLRRDRLVDMAGNSFAGKPQRLRFIGRMAAEFDTLDLAVLKNWSVAAQEEVRAQAAWLIGIRGRPEEVPLLLELVTDKDPFVRRRAAEALGRFGDPRATKPLIELMGDADRHVRYAAMTALAQRPRDEFLAAAAAQGDLRIAMRALVATQVRNERASADAVQPIVQRLLKWKPVALEDQLDRLRVFSLFKNEIVQSAELRGAVHQFLLTGLPADERDLRWEQVRLVGQFGVGEGFAPLLKMLESGTEGTTQFHIAMAMAGIPEGWTPAESTRLAKWLISTQTGWFAELNGKGRQFGGFWATTLNQLAERHALALGGLIDEIIPGSQLASIAFRGLNSRPDADQIILKQYRAAKTDAARMALLDVMSTMNRPSIGKFLVGAQQQKGLSPAMQKGLLKALASNPMSPEETAQIFLTKLMSSDDQELIALAVQRLRDGGLPISSYANWLPNAKIGERHGAQAVYFRLLELMPQQAAVVEGVLATLTGRQRPGSGSAPEVIWSSGKQIDNDQVWFAHEFEVAGTPGAGELAITCDNEFTAFINGEQVAASKDWVKPLRADVLKALRSGKNVIAVHGVNLGGPAGLIAKLKWTGDGGSGAVSTNSRWRMTKRPSESWQTDGARDGATWVASVNVSEPTKNALEAFREFEPFDPDVSGIIAQEFWQDWYRGKFNEAFVARPVKVAKLMTDGALHSLIKDAKNLDEGDAAHGRQVYLNTGCFACHGGIDEKAATLFGPALTGATLRLKRKELADAIVYPSKLVAERFKATVLKTTDGRTLNGFVTENSDDFVSLTDLQNKVTRLPKAKVKSIKAQESSLMPAKLLSTLSEKDVRDLLAFLAALK
jgi:putative heme-binding domain-containing protein